MSICIATTYFSLPQVVAVFITFETHFLKIYFSLENMITQGQLDTIGRKVGIVGRMVQNFQFSFEQMFSFHWIMRPFIAMKKQNAS